MLEASMMQMDVGPLFGLFLQSFFIGITMRIERGIRACSLESLIDLAQELHTSTDYLLTGTGPANDFAKEQLLSAIEVLSSVSKLI